MMVLDWQSERRSKLTVALGQEQWCIEEVSEHARGVQVQDGVFRTMLDGLGHV